MKLSVIIPSYKDPLLENTIGSLLANSGLGDKLEIIAVLDGYWPPRTVGDPRVRYIHLGRNRGMRGAINAGVTIARGEFIMRTDEHCMFAQGFDKTMTDACQPNWIMNARRYFLNPQTWTVIEDAGFVEHEKLVIQGEEGGIQKFTGQRWRSRDRARRHKLIDKTMAMQGSVWLMPRQWWIDVIGELQTEGYGPHYQDSHEMVFKTWQNGGELMLHRGTWYAHKHRSFRRTHDDGTKENPANKEVGWKYSLDVWRDYYETTVRPRWGI